MVDLRLSLCFVFLCINSIYSVLVRVPGRNCTFREGNQIYDLSELASRDHWIYTENNQLNPSEKSIYLYSICHPIQGFSSCSADDGVCFSRGSEPDSLRMYSSGGKWKDGLVPELYEEGHLKITYSQGSNCSYSMFAPSSLRTYTTDMYIQCPTGDELESPGPFLMTTTHCSYIFVWVTKAACPIKVEVEKDSCMVDASNLNHPINLHNLNSNSFYSLQYNDTTFQMNFCGPINHGACKDQDSAICDATKNISLAKDSQRIVKWDDHNGVLMMQYRGQKNIDIQLVCDRTAFSPKVYYSSHVNNTADHTFLMHTTVVCAPRESNCILEDDHQNVYDLRSLHKKRGNWEVLGTVPHAKNKLFHINICGPLNKDKSASCPAGPLGACQTSITPQTAQNIGYITSNPVVKKDGTIVILYTGGDSCRANVKSSSSRITLTCSPIEHYPILIDITDTCEHIFEWHTPAACPKNVVVGADCKVTDPLLGWTFNLNPLRKLDSDYTVTYRYNKFRVNLCGPLTKPCNDLSPDSSVCHSEISGGKSPGELVFNDGTLLMKYKNGSRCGTNQTYSTQILFVCNQNQTKAMGLQYLPVPEDSCTFNFIWPTVLACPTFTTVNCSVTDGDNFYDLSPLSNPSTNEIYITTNLTKRYVFNVCRSVVHSKENRCPYHAGACLIESSRKGESLNLGNVYASPYVENGNLQIRYKNGAKCNSTNTYETVIYFKCSQDLDTYPELIKNENCLVVFEWSTIHACPRKLIAPSIASGGTCSITHPINGFVYNMSSLSGRDSSKLHITSDTYVLFNICGKVEDFECSNLNASACLVDSKKGTYSSAGSVSNELHFKSWSPYLEYTGGDMCENGMRRSTRVSFVCSTNNSLNGPILIDNEEASCTIFINWYTELACDRRIQCFANSWDRSVDLSRFSRFFQNYEIKNPTNENIVYYINVCRPLNPIQGINCHPGSAACLVEKMGRSQKVVSLGHPYLNPVITSANRTELMYAQGSNCRPYDGGPKFSSRISFVCDQTIGVGSPQFSKMTHDCQVQFEWRTSLVCDTPQRIETTSQCHIYYKEAKANIDLTPLFKPSGYKIPFADKTFLVNVCGSVCDKSGVCTTGGENYGLSGNSKLEWKKSGLLITYYSGDLCASSLSRRKSSMIFFPCDMNAGYGSPVVDVSTNDFECIGVFNWRTNITCLESFYSKPSQPRKPVPTSKPTVTYEETGHQTSAVIGIVVLMATIAIVVLVVTKTRQGRHFVTKVKGIFSKKGSETIIMDDDFVSTY